MRHPVCTEAGFMLHVHLKKIFLATPFAVNS
jgi:hypothetical protein